MPDREDLKTAKSQALKHLSYRDRSKRELIQYLEKKEHAPSVIQKTIQYLVSLNYINDQRFAMEWGRSRIENKKFGKERVRQELFTKGIASNIIEIALDTLYDANPEKDLALACASKKLASLHGLEPEKKTRRLAHYLQRRGFSADIIYETLKISTTNNESCDL
ncbi:MAG: regulatory protein RecX [Nitrospina sp.]|jgi:regulatory protein|nr:regulatory protein RecX [Nitrospina sp.]MBT3876419.1 regulatory protein RecX [Nitrospina sp.]MBT4047553.1 regulatory protein RecX [Nitrospina sp.]MBT4558090.1 regulatory protein RecX [Nitrospina sp.]MBT5349437.1 regulatory protein RecX [Nitrospina sp.]